MRSLRLLAVFVLAGFIAFCLTAGVQEKETGRIQADQAIAQPVQQMVERLNLTDEQEKQLKSLLQEGSKKRQGVVRDTELARQRNEERRKALQEELDRLGEGGTEFVNARKGLEMLQKDFRDQLKAILTPQQLEQWRKMAETDPAVITNSIGMKLRRIPAGSFRMGSDHDRDELPVHKVTFTKPFYIGVYEVTQREFQEIMGRNPSAFQGETYPHWAGARNPAFKDERRPVDSVTWYDAQEFCARLWAREGVEYRLPTEAEWEYACRAGTTAKYYWGDTYDPAYCWSNDKTGNRGQTAEVGLKRPNAWGLYDMIGNVKEWCEDAYKPYPADDQVDPAPVSGGCRVLRGGDWCNYGPCSDRACRSPLDAPGGGFRVVRPAR